MQISFRESLDFRGVGKVDRESSTIHGVKVCGNKSANGRRYTRDALQKASRLYEGARVFFDHPAGESNTRQFHDRFARLVNVKADDAGGLTADLRYNPAHPAAEQFLWLAENDPEGMGLSHNAEGRGRRDDNGDVLVEEITKVHSVDIVDGPATTFSLFEQTDTLRENMDPITDPAAAAAPADDFAGQLSELAKTIAAHPDWDKATKLAKIKSLLSMLEDAEADKDGDGKKDDKEPDGDEMPEPEMMEQLGKFKSKAVKQARAKLLRESRKSLAVSKGLTADLITETFLEQIAGATEPLALKLIEDRRAVATVAKAEKPTNSPAGSTPLTPAQIAKTINWN